MDRYFERRRRGARDRVRRLARALRARRRAFGGIAASLLAVAVALPSTGHAFEIRRSEGDVTVAADETINDTLLAAGQTVTIDGTINGDLLAFGRDVTVRGNVTGNLVTGARADHDRGHASAAAS